LKQFVSEIESHCFVSPKLDTRTILFDFLYIDKK